MIEHPMLAEIDQLSARIDATRNGIADETEQILSAVAVLLDVCYSSMSEDDPTEWTLGNVGAAEIVRVIANCLDSGEGNQ